MSRVIVKYDPQGATRPDKRFTEKTGKCAIDIIMDEMPISFEYIVATLNGLQLELPVIGEGGKVIERGNEEALTRNLTKDDHLRIMCIQKGGIGKALSKIVNVVLTPITTILSWVYQTPSYSSKTKTQETGSTKKDLAGQTNTTNLYNAIPDRFGENTIYLDLIDNEFWSEYEANNKNITQFMCLGAGEFDWSDVYLGTTQIGLVEGATVTRFDPVNGITTIPDYFYSRSVEQVDRSDLQGPGSRRVALASNSQTVYFTYNSVSDVGRIDIGGTNVDPIFNNYFSTGDTVTLQNADEILGDPTYTYTEDTNNDGVIDENDDPTTTVTHYDLSGTYVISGVDRRWIEFQNASTVVADWDKIDSDFGTGTTSHQDGSTEDNIIVQSTSSALTFQGPFNTAIPARGFLLDFGFYQGLKRSVTIRVNYNVYSELDGPVIDSGTFDITYSGNTLDQLNYTYRFEYSGVDENSYYFDVEVARTSAESTDAATPDTVKWDRFAAFAQISNKTFPYGVSLIRLDIPYSASALSTSQNKVNITATRKTITYDKNTGEIDYTLTPTTTFADALLHEYVVVFGKPASELDLDALYEISDRIGDPLNRFSYTFDDLSQKLKERMDIICNAARVSVYWDGQMYRFYRDEQVSLQPMLITRTDIAHPTDRDYSRTYNPALPSQYDSIKLEYIYPDRNNEAAYIRRTYDQNGNIVEGLGQNPNSITLAGCRNREQAINRAELEIRKLLYARWSVQDTLMKNGYLMDLGDVVLYADTFRQNAFAGEILSINGDRIYLSSIVKLEQGVDYEISYNDEYMESFGPYPLVGGDGENTRFVTISNVNNLANAYTRDSDIGYERQVGSRFIINRVSEGRQEVFRITKKEGVDDQHVNITLSQYDDRMYQFDNQ